MPVNDHSISDMKEASKVYYKERAQANSRSAGKGDKRRPGNNALYRENYDRIFSKEPAPRNP